MMHSDIKLIKPSIVICISEDGQDEYKIREIKAGIEEEGIPYSLLQAKNSDAIALAWQAAAASQLGVGVGVSPAGVCIHYHKLSEDTPLFISETASNPGIWRQFGYNAARLVKGLPFKDNDNRKSVIDIDDEAQLYEQVYQIVMKVLSETAQGAGRSTYV
ncbi:glycerol dehydratase reactivase beta/small subunit family protein [Sporomusa acidovorans]|uniref:Dehydratase medium subunit n=1 Tax=Sporomusa acidovorans (strain ATCC 49682 / DSM 3132 / Mol) TaxID=1123286 RepID=A0ABZ3JA15_SPOA4|nr:glycerol dehydratase reactivase beta/small subunit family protein [Sporomusa acidovorans]OZC17340.1 dehydratase medium subunit [Sporomusa acidovorans DSM 3132]SDF45545.1 propanediol dehydratase reactivation factor, small subunit [Sporomusa acidovorans]